MSSSLYTSILNKVHNNKINSILIFFNVSLLVVRIPGVRGEEVSPLLLFV